MPIPSRVEQASEGSNHKDMSDVSTFHGRNSIFAMMLVKPVAMSCFKKMYRHLQGKYRHYAVVNVYIAMENHHVQCVDEVQMAIFNSYVSLPEGN